jgi:citronellol/citronellal dehydrogenase
MSLRGKTLFISGASRGIGLAIALRAARDGANIVVAAKTVAPHAHLPGTIHTAAQEIEKAGGRALAVVLDVRDEASIEAAVKCAVETFGGIDICVNNASAIAPTGTLEMTAKRFDLMHQVNTRGTFLVSKACIPYLQRAANPHVLNLSPPLTLEAAWLRPHIAYTISKYGMSLCALGMAAEFREQGIAFNALWPISTIDTSAIRFVLGGEALSQASRTPQIMADAAYLIFSKSSREFTGQLCIDELVLRAEGVVDFSAYAVVPGEPLHPDMFVTDAIRKVSGTRFTDNSEAW